jgi:hypothetical protein
VKDTNLMILFNNETKILAQNSKARSKNSSKIEPESPRKIGTASSRNNNFNISTGLTPGSITKKREFIDPIDLITGLHEKSGEGAGKYYK